MDTQLREFGDWLRREIDRRGWSVSEFSRHLGSGRSTVNKWLTGKTQPERWNCHRIADALSISEELYIDPNEVLYRAGRPPDDRNWRLETRRRRTEIDTEDLHGIAEPSRIYGERLSPEQRRMLNETDPSILELIDQIIELAKQLERIRGRRD